MAEGQKEQMEEVVLIKIAGLDFGISEKTKISVCEKETNKHRQSPK